MHMRRTPRGGQRSDGVRRQVRQTGLLPLGSESPILVNRAHAPPDFHSSPPHFDFERKTHTIRPGDTHEIVARLLARARKRAKATRRAMNRPMTMVIVQGVFAVDPNERVRFLDASVEG